MKKGMTKMNNSSMSDYYESDKSRFFQDLRKVEIVRNGKCMKWDERTNSFVELDKAGAKYKRKKMHD